MKKVLVLSIDGNMKPVDMPDKVGYDFLKDTVDGYIEIVRRVINGVECDICLNDEGKLIPLPICVVHLDLEKQNVLETYEGNVVIMKFDGIEDNEGFNDREIKKIQEGLKVGLLTEDVLGTPRKVFLMSRNTFDESPEYTIGM